MMPQEPTNKRRRQSAGPTTSTNAVACPIAVDDDPRVGVINTLSPIIGSTNPTTSTERHLHPQVHLVRQGPQHTDASTTTIHSTTTTSTSSRDMRTGLNSPSLNSPLYTPLPGWPQHHNSNDDSGIPIFWERFLAVATYVITLTHPAATNATADTTATATTGAAKDSDCKSVHARPIIRNLNYIRYEAAAATAGNISHPRKASIISCVPYLCKADWCATPKE
ncbi:hypothetical protein Pelo_9856 [Pelomyxa schiedti]|nr:hypothetical protein Pelo_9856 [Pelomyxa schiedti]